MAIAVLAGCGGGEAAAPPPAAPSASASAAPAAPTASTAEATPAPAPTPKPALIDLEKKALADWYAGFNGHDAKKLGSLYAADAVSVRTGPGGWTDPVTGPDAIGNSFSGLFGAFSDLKAAPVRVLAKKDLVVVQWASTGTNDGEMMGPPTKKKAAVYGCDIFWFDDAGAIKRQETFHDDSTILRQIGKMPGKAPKLAVIPDKDAEWVVAENTADEDGLVEKMKATWPATWSKHDAKGYEAVVTDDGEHIDYSVPAEFKGKTALLKEFDAYMKAMPDMNVTIEKAWGFPSGIVVAEFTAVGTLKGNLGPMKANGKTITFHGVDIDELKDGKMAKGYTYGNGLEILAAAGMLPKPPAAKAAKPDAAKPETMKK
jgi:ketosteroid isomerase-like protein